MQSTSLYLMMSLIARLPSSSMLPMILTDSLNFSSEKEMESTSSALRESMSRLKATRSSVTSIYSVRVGGGFLTLDEFLRINIPIELEKMAQKDPISVLSKNVGRLQVTQPSTVSLLEDQSTRRRRTKRSLH